MERKFKVGDRVKFMSHNPTHILQGREGEVIEVYGSPPGARVRFLPGGETPWCWPEHLELVESEEEELKMRIKAATEFFVGDRVRSVNAKSLLYGAQGSVTSVTPTCVTVNFFNGEVARCGPEELELVEAAVEDYERPDLEVSGYQLGGVKAERVQKYSNSLAPAEQWAISFHLQGENRRWVVICQPGEVVDLMARAYKVTLAVREFLADAEAAEERAKEKK